MFYRRLDMKTLCLKGETVLNKTRYYLVVTLIIPCMIIGLYGSQRVLAQSKPKLVVDSAFYDYGEVLRGKKVSHSFVIKNEGEATLMIKDAKPG